MFVSDWLTGAVLSMNQIQHAKDSIPRNEKISLKNIVGIVPWTEVKWTYRSI